MMDKKVVVYSSDSCLYCRMAKSYLEKNNVSFEEKNVGTDAQARNELAAKGYTGVPVIMVGETEILGFDQPKLKEALGLE